MRGRDGRWSRLSSLCIIDQINQWCRIELCWCILSCYLETASVCRHIPASRGEVSRDRSKSQCYPACTSMTVMELCVLQFYRHHTYAGHGIDPHRDGSLEFSATAIPSVESSPNYMSVNSSLLALDYHGNTPASVHWLRLGRQYESLPLKKSPSPSGLGLVPSSRPLPVDADMGLINADSVESRS